VTDFDDDLIYHETVSQPYSNCKFSAGFVDNHPIDTLYLKIERDNDDTFIIVLRPDEMAAIAYCAAGILWSHLNDVQEKKSEVEDV
jgi:hypothetical protein